MPMMTMMMVITITETNEICRPVTTFACDSAYWCRSRQPMFVPVTKLKLAVNPVRPAAAAAAAAAAGGGELRDVRVTCKLPDAPLISIGGLLSEQ